MEVDVASPSAVPDCDEEHLDLSNSNRFRDSAIIRNCLDQIAEEIAEVADVLQQVEEQKSHNLADPISVPTRTICSRKWNPQISFCRVLNKPKFKMINNRFRIVGRYFVTENRL